MRPKPWEDEILSSWLIRCSIMNGSDPTSFADAIWPKSRMWTKDMDRFLPEDKVYALSEATSLSPGEIVGMTLAGVIEKVTHLSRMKPTIAWPWVIPTGSRSRKRVNGLHFCPKCLGLSTVYFKKQWRLSWNVACPHHSILLHIHCPACHSVFSPQLVQYDDGDVSKCHMCGYDLKSTSSLPANEMALDLQEYLNAIAINDQYAKDVFPLLEGKTHLVFATVRLLMRFFRRADRCQAVQRVVGRLDGQEERRLKHAGNLLDMAGVDERHYLLTLVGKLCKMQHNDVLFILREEGVTRQMFERTKCELESTIDDIMGALKDNVRGEVHRKLSTRSLEPKSKREIEIKMDELRRYL
ncbi:TniQ family protein [Sulfurimonas sp. HSL-3221]|uniref:TniQ family protein n=1 Tax=Sulfurimonadaceae TaxID=2771471 RepID=UPI001E39F813|nr:TniQ family protein [Sulfurimonas sp. HSL-3221]UFS63802.1 TniQ family protein [Sulfurimonas sp. HSL-3221]